MELLGPLLLIHENFLTGITIHITVIALERIANIDSISLRYDGLGHTLPVLRFKLFGGVIALIHLAPSVDFSPALLSFLLVLNMLFDELGDLRVLHEFLELFNRNIRLIPLSSYLSSSDEDQK